MSPRRRTSDAWWLDSDYQAPVRRAVDGGVKASKPGTATSDEGKALVDGAKRLCTAAIATRARTYARHGQVVGVDVGEKTAVAQVQGSGEQPYLLSLYRRDFGDYTADCDCPYGCGERYWCKHAVALAFVVADMIDHDPALLAHWSGQPAPTPPAGVRIAPDVLQRLAEPLPELDVVAVMASAAEVAPPPVV